MSRPVHEPGHVSFRFINQPLRDGHGNYCKAADLRIRKLLVAECNVNALALEIRISGGVTAIIICHQ